MAKLAQPPKLAARWQASIDDHVISLAWSPDNSTLAAASVSGPIVLFDATDGRIKHTLPGHQFGTAVMSWQPGGAILASCGQDGKIRLWNTSAGTEIVALDAASPWVERVVWNPRGDRLVSAAGKKIRLWNEEGELVRAYPDREATIADIKWSAKGKEFAAGGYGSVAFFTPDADEPHRQFNWKGSILALAWSPDGKYLAGGSQDSSVHFWYTKDGKDLEMTGYPRKVQELAWDVASKYLATGGGNIVMVWDCAGKGPAGTNPLNLELHAEPLTFLTFQNRGPLLASACSEGLLALWFPGGFKRVLTQAKLEAGISQLAWAFNDRCIAVGGDAGYVGVWAV